MFGPPRDSPEPPAEPPGVRLREDDEGRIEIDAPDVDPDGAGAPGNPLPPERPDSSNKAYCEEQWRKVPPWLQQSIRNVHHNLGHVGQRKMAWFFQAGNASVAAKDALRWFWCDVCRSRTKQSVPRTARIPEASDFNELLQMDVGFFRDLSLIHI